MARFSIGVPEIIDAATGKFKFKVYQNMGGGASTIYYLPHAVDPATVLKGEMQFNTGNLGVFYGAGKHANAYVSDYLYYYTNPSHYAYTYQNKNSIPALATWVTGYAYGYYFADTYSAPTIGAGGFVVEYTITPQPQYAASVGSMKIEDFFRFLGLVPGAAPVTHTYSYGTFSGGNNWDISAAQPLIGTTTPGPIITKLDLAKDPAQVLMGASSLLDPGATAADPHDSMAALSVTTTSDVDLSTAGNYTITYSATASDGVSDTATRAVEVIEAQVSFDGAIADGASMDDTIGAATSLVVGVNDNFINDTFTTLDLEQYPSLISASDLTLIKVHDQPVLDPPSLQASGTPGIIGNAVTWGKLIYVDSATGLDSNAGDASSPLKTIQAANLKAQEFISAEWPPEYVHDELLDFNGVSQAPETYHQYKKDCAIILHGEFEIPSDEIIFGPGIMEHGDYNADDYILPGGSYPPHAGTLYPYSPRFLTGDYLLNPNHRLTTITPTAQTLRYSRATVQYAGFNERTVIKPLGGYITVSGNCQVGGMVFDFGSIDHGDNAAIEVSCTDPGRTQAQYQYASFKNCVFTNQYSSENYAHLTKFVGPYTPSSSNLNNLIATGFYSVKINRGLLYNCNFNVWAANSFEGFVMSYTNTTTGNTYTTGNIQGMHVSITNSQIHSCPRYNEDNGVNKLHYRSYNIAVGEAELLFQPYTEGTTINPLFRTGVSPFADALLGYEVEPKTYRLLLNGEEGEFSSNSYHPLNENEDLYSPQGPYGGNFSTLYYSNVYGEPLSPWKVPSVLVATDSVTSNLAQDIGDVRIYVNDVLASENTQYSGHAKIAASLFDSANNTIRAEVVDHAGQPVNTANSSATLSLIGASASITLTGDSSIDHEWGTAWTDPGYAATDSSTGDITSQVAVTGTVNTSTDGTYTLTYSVTGSDGNAVSTTRAVIVADRTSPAVTVTGAASIALQPGDSYTDAGATATDNKDGAVAVVTTGLGAVSDSGGAITGTHTITYTATDAASNVGTATRTVTVADTIPPVVTVLGNDPEDVIVGATYTDAGATATDAVDGSLTVVTTGVSAISDSGGAIEGTHTVTYTATDASSNVATATRTVVVAPPFVKPGQGVNQYDYISDPLVVGLAAPTGAGGLAQSDDGEAGIYIDLDEFLHETTGVTVWTRNTSGVWSTWDATPSKGFTFPWGTSEQSIYFQLGAASNKLVRVIKIQEAIVYDANKADDDDSSQTLRRKDQAPVALNLTLGEPIIEFAAPSWAPSEVKTFKTPNSYTPVIQVWTYEGTLATLSSPGDFEIDVIDPDAASITRLVGSGKVKVRIMD